MCARTQRSVRSGVRIAYDSSYCEHLDHCVACGACQGWTSSSRWSGGLAVIRSFDAEHPQLTLSEVAACTGLTRATARRLLLTLGELGYVSADGRRSRHVSRKLDIGYAYLSSLNVQQIAQPYLEALSERVHESVSVTVLDGADIVYVARASRPSGS